VGSLRHQVQRWLEIRFASGPVQRQRWNCGGLQFSPAL